MSWLPAAIASLTARGASCGAAASPLGRIFAVCPGVSGSGPPAAEHPAAPAACGRARGLGGGCGRGDLAEEAAGAGVRGGRDGDVPDAPRVLGGAALPVVDVDVASDDRATRIAGVERVSGRERVGGDVRKALQRDHRRVDGDLVRGLSGGEVEAGGGDAGRR